MPRIWWTRRSLKKKGIKGDDGVVRFDRSWRREKREEGGHVADNILELATTDALLGSHGTNAIVAGTGEIASAAKSGVSALAGFF